jgi:2-hydroxychromene-2-carboxylate isomerase
MSKTIDYFYSHVSPWTLLGHDRLRDVAGRTGARIVHHPITVSEIFPKTGGVPLAKRPPERRAYRMQELRRWSKHLDIPLTLEPAFFPADDRPSQAFAVASMEAGADVHELSGAILRAIWQQERDVADWDTLAAIGLKAGLDGPALVANAQSEAIAARAQAECEAALGAGCFGVPWYSVDGEGFWGQDRLELLEDKLRNG